MILKVKDSGRLFFLQNYAEPYKIYLADVIWRTVW